MTVYRITNCKYINDLSGKGAALYGGRWNSKDVYIVYTAESRALALLEAVVHMGPIVMNYCIAEIEIPENSIEEVAINRLVANWSNNPSPDIIKEIGDTFIKKGKHLVLRIPSAIMPEEHNYLINPNHEGFKKVKIIAHRPVKIDERFF